MILARQRTSYGLVELRLFVATEAKDQKVEIEIQHLALYGPPDQHVQLNTTVYQNSVVTLFKTFANGTFSKKLKQNSLSLLRCRYPKPLCFLILIFINILVELMYISKRTVLILVAAFNSYDRSVHGLATSTHIQYLIIHLDQNRKILFSQLLVRHTNILALIKLPKLSF